MTQQISLEAACQNCAALCCLALAFDRGPQFAIDKPAGMACPNLNARGLCTIHQSLTEQGFPGCVNYSCYGAGQRVTQEIFAGKSWQQDPSLMQPMMEVFRAMRLVHELLLLLREAGKLPLSPPQKTTRRRLEKALSPQPGWTRETLLDFETGPLPRQTRTFFASLGDVVPRG